MFTELVAAVVVPSENGGGDGGGEAIGKIGDNFGKGSNGKPLILPI